MNTSQHVLNGITYEVSYHFSSKKFIDESFEVGTINRLSVAIAWSPGEVFKNKLEKIAAKNKKADAKKEWIDKIAIAEANMEGCSAHIILTKVIASKVRQMKVVAQCNLASSFLLVDMDKQFEDIADLVIALEEMRHNCDERDKNSIISELKKSISNVY